MTAKKKATAGVTTEGTTAEETIASGFDETLSLMATTVSRMDDFIMQRLREEGVKGIVPSHGGILYALYTRGPATKGQLAHLISRSPSTVTALVHKLEDLGFVTVSRRPEDIRVSIVSLTPRGREFAPHFVTASQALQSVIEDTLEDDERDQLRSSLVKLCEAFA